MNINAIHTAIKTVIKNHSHAFFQLGSSQSKLLELGSIVGTAEHFKSLGYSISVVNPVGKTDFIAKVGTRGFPWNFSHILVSNGSRHFELHMNLTVRSAHDQGVYCVDVGVAELGSVPSAPGTVPWICIDNHHLHSFAEAKKLVIYPMLLAQFIGIVHEIKPEYLNPHIIINSQLPPTLISIGHYSGNSQNIAASFVTRGFNILIAENFDHRLSMVNLGMKSSPFT